MRPVDNFSAPRLASLSISVGACRRAGCVFRCRDSPCQGFLDARGERPRMQGERGHGTVFAAGVRRSLPHTPPGAFLQRSDRGARIGMLEGPAADRGDRHWSPSLCFVGFVRLKNLAQNLFRNVSASCAGDPCWSLLNAPVPWS